MDAILSNFAPSTETSLPSKVEFVVIAPVIAPPVKDSLPFKEVVTAVWKSLSSSNAAANSFKVFNVPGAPSIKLLICVVTKS